RRVRRPAVRPDRFPRGSHSVDTPDQSDSCCGVPPRPGASRSRSACRVSSNRAMASSFEPSGASAPCLRQPFESLFGALPNALNALLRALPEALDALLGALPEALDALLRALPEARHSASRSLSHIPDRTPGASARTLDDVAGVPEKIVSAAADVAERVADALEQLRVAIERREDARENLR